MPEFSMYSIYSLNTEIGHIQIAGSDYIDSWDIIFDKKSVIKQMPFDGHPSQAAYGSLQRTPVCPRQHTLVIYPSLSDQLDNNPMVSHEADTLHFVIRVADNHNTDQPVGTIPGVIDVFFINSCNNMCWHILIHLSQVTSKSYLVIPLEASIEIQFEQSYIYSNGVTHFINPAPGATAQMPSISHNHSSLPIDTGLIAYYQPIDDTADALEKFVTQFWLFQRSELTRHHGYDAMTVKEPPPLPSTLTALSELMITAPTESLTDPSDITGSPPPPDDESNHIKQNAEQPPNQTEELPEQDDTEKYMAASLECAEKSFSTGYTNTDSLLLPKSNGNHAIEWDEALYNKLDSEEKDIWAAKNTQKIPHINEENRQKIISKARGLLDTYEDLNLATPISLTEQQSPNKDIQRRYIPSEHLSVISKLFQPGVIDASIAMHERQPIYHSLRLFLAKLLDSIHNDRHNADNFNEPFWREFSQLFVSAIKHIKYILPGKSNLSTLLIFLNTAIIYNDINAYIKILPYLPDSFNHERKKSLIAEKKEFIVSIFNNGWQLFQAHQQQLTATIYSKPINLDAVTMLIQGAKALDFWDVSPWQQQLLQWT
ncbi:hypothetical protein [Endozoicomonas sp. Mp262]|uniref:hypothetical protein n=1 Tax=Endozoicomonas sp. Mp262 TaxID=2919499 RepID=UPI0021D91DD7